MFKLPQQFDENEWFITAAVIVLVACYNTLPKIMPYVMTLSVFLFFAVFGLVSDVLIGVDYPVDYYQITDSQKLELFDVIGYVLVYPYYGYLFAYILIKWDMRFAALMLFLLLWCGLTTGVEWLSVQFRVFTYLNGWNIGYSFLCYLVIFPFSAVVIRLFHRLWRQEFLLMTRP